MNKTIHSIPERLNLLPFTLEIELMCRSWSSDWVTKVRTLFRLYLYLKLSFLLWSFRCKTFRFESIRHPKSITYKLKSIRYKLKLFRSESVLEETSQWECFRFRIAYSRPKECGFGSYYTNKLFWEGEYLCLKVSELFPLKLLSEASLIWREVLGKSDEPHGEANHPLQLRFNITYNNNNNSFIYPLFYLAFRWNFIIPGRKLKQTEDERLFAILLISRSPLLCPV